MAFMEGGFRINAPRSRYQLQITPASKAWNNRCFQPETGVLYVSSYTLSETMLLRTQLMTSGHLSQTASLKKTSKNNGNSTPQNPCSIQEPLVSFEALESWSPMSNFETTDATELVTDGSMIKRPINLVWATPDSNKVVHVVTIYILESV